MRFIPACAGNAPIHPFSVLNFRFIPACAGNATRQPCGGTTGTGSSPRVRGTPMPSVCRLLCPGSSPRVRGTPNRQAAQHRLVRFIPACAGNANRHGLCKRRSARFIPACAGNALVAGSLVFNIGGSSPRVRGTRRWPLDHIVLNPGSSPRVRGTPATACRVAASSSVHPRVCGERMVDMPPGDHNDRFIPACAGNARRKSASRRPLLRFIPACAGNAYSGQRPGQQSAGSSPRVRGTPRLDARRPSSASVHPRVCGERCRCYARQSNCMRFIPACAGNALTVSRRDPDRFGSSPRVRGTLMAGCWVSLTQRFIPACAGNANG